MEKGDENRKKKTSQCRTNRIEIDCVVFNFEDESLKVLLVKQKDNERNTNWELLSDTIKEGETISGTAQNILKKYIGVDNFFLEQLKAFGYPSPSSSYEDISIGYYALIKRDTGNVENHVAYSNLEWIGINEISGLSDKHKIILDYSLKELRQNICKTAIGFNLLPEKFTLLQVMHLYEEILGIEINKSNFRRKILQMNLVHDSNEKEEAVSHRAAKFYSLNLQQHEMLAHRELNFNF
ncbi:NUDIX hydrolase [Flavobacterium sp. Leaf82]|uniref:NUDIX hydrolase n=1 Tax=unclassified Flavobacterium TaxID=196869 RepID=UPI0007021C71|nr:NUDIX domain-containing protein [Flavobacterium sp. Leaf82]KQO29054.1 NUDIX hydrolase [Flavobacterium sp. Leaf82]